MLLFFKVFFFIALVTVQSAEVIFGSEDNELETAWNTFQESYTRGTRELLEPFSKLQNANLNGEEIGWKEVQKCISSLDSWSNFSDETSAWRKNRCSESDISLAILWWEDRYKNDFRNAKKKALGLFKEGTDGASLRWIEEINHWERNSIEETGRDSAPPLTLVRQMGATLEKYRLAQRSTLTGYADRVAAGNVGCYGECWHKCVTTGCFHRFTTKIRSVLPSMCVGKSKEFSDEVLLVALLENSKEARKYYKDRLEERHRREMTNGWDGGTSKAIISGLGMCCVGVAFIVELLASVEKGHGLTPEAANVIGLGCLGLKAVFDASHWLIVGSPLSASVPHQFRPAKRAGGTVQTFWSQVGF